MRIDCHRVTADDGTLGEQHLRDFQDDEKSIPTVLTTSQKLSTGVDAPQVRNIVLLRPVNSMVEFKQIIGRGTRLFEGKDYFTVYDFVEAHHHFRNPSGTVRRRSQNRCSRAPPGTARARRASGDAQCGRGAAPGDAPGAAVAVRGARAGQHGPNDVLVAGWHADFVGAVPPQPLWGFAGRVCPRMSFASCGVARIRGASCSRRWRSGDTPVTSWRTCGRCSREGSDLYDVLAHIGLHRAVGGPCGAR